MLHRPAFRMTFWKFIFFLIMAVGAYAMYVRVFHGLGASTAMSDDFPWGLWVSFDVMTGVALAAGGFTIAATVYVLHLEEFRPILRPTILTAFLGYLLVCVSLMCDLGRPDRIWHPMVMWNHHSVMFEVAWCVMLYNTVLALEFSPAVLERLGWKRALRVVHMLTPLLVIAGVVLSTLHQSSLGTVFVIVPTKLHGLWYTPMLPLLFYLSAICVGLAMTIFESYLSNRAFGVSLHGHLLAKLGKALAVALAVYLVAKLATLAAAGHLGLLFEGSIESLLFALELGLGVVIPMALLFSSRVRHHRTAMFYAAFLVILGLVLNRMNVGITGMQRHAAVNYLPSFLEVATSIAFVAGGFAVFGFVVRNFPIFSSESEGGQERPVAWAQVADGVSSPRYATLAGGKGVWVFLGLAMLFGTALIVGQLMPDKHDTSVWSAQSIAMDEHRDMKQPQDVQLRLPDNHVIRTSNRSPAPVVFSHARHVGKNLQSCTNCHPKPFGMVPMDSGGQECASATMAGCATCHDGRSTFEVGAGCRICHPVDNRKGQALTGRDNCASCHAHWKPGTVTPSCPGTPSDQGPVL